jgi:glutamate-1-semialdehyde 2,1-aminomutase
LDEGARRLALTTRSDLYRRALDLIPGGVNSPVRAMRAVGVDEPLFVRRGEGAYIEDADGNRYVDWVMSWGPLLFGHADSDTVRAVRHAAERGTSFGAATEAEVDLAAAIVDAVPSVEKVRLVSSGTEAAMSAVRLARAFTSRDRILKFAGCYHGHVDALLADAGSGVATLGLPTTPGIPTATTAHTIVCAYNDVDGVAHAVAQHGEGLAAIIVEPVAGNMGVVPPEPGFLEALRALCDASGALLVFDEVISGFRVARGGAQGLFGVMPDLTILGKIVGGGLPLAAFGGRADVMDRVAPSGDVYQAGTLSGNPLAMAAGLATLDLLRGEGAYDRLEQTSAAVAGGLEAPGVTVNRVGAMLTAFFSEAAVTDFATASAADTGRYARFHAHMLARGVYLAPSQFEAMMPSLAHTAEQIEMTVAAAREFEG